ncbi:hypothetical protein W02_17470 [Nitrospira sp. KM1]|uniref:ribonuclease H-like domain-containing protein n=1 Tax=Nitrospira sp. KM1 TaxID=1936990 RepID=UPI0013A71727|nr:ribonuclease H-like domain-containing protein [Nitrospira sp. KM1]BCA54607.1 hypothetical protein W02_17470 [Nitrospira sp. KM1]
MIESSFCLLPGIGRTTERRLWRQGIRSWNDFLGTPSIAGISATRKTLWDKKLLEAHYHRTRENARYFGVTLPGNEHWRLYEWLRSRTLFLDIETDSSGRITVVGLYGRGRCLSLVRGESLTRRRLCDELTEYGLLVTFNGASFDLPMLLNQFPTLPLDQPHIDLCRLARRLGYRGGLKAVERQCSIQRRTDLQGLSGHDAVCLWNRWRYGGDSLARERVVAYNEADCVNLQPLADRMYCEMARVLTGSA